MLFRICVCFLPISSCDGCNDDFWMGFCRSNDCHWTISILTRVSFNLAMGTYAIFDAPSRPIRKASSCFAGCGGLRIPPRRDTMENMIIVISDMTGEKN